MLTIALALSTTTALLWLWVIVRLCVMRRHREYPLFLAYNALEIIDFLALLLVMRYAVPFFLTYWFGEILLSIVALLVLLAVFAPAAEVLYIRHPKYRLFLPVALATIVSIAVWQTLYHPLRHSWLGHLASGMYSFVLGILFLEAIILAVCLALAISKRIPWGRYDFAIVAGFGLSAAMKLATYLVRWNFGDRFETLVRYLVPAAALGAALIWVVAFSRAEPRITKREPDAGELKRLIALLEEHTDYVRQILAHPELRRRSLPDPPR